MTDMYKILLFMLPAKLIILVDGGWFNTHGVDQLFSTTTALPQAEYFDHKFTQVHLCFNNHIESMR